MAKVDDQYEQPNESLKPQRQRVDLSVGVMVQVGDDIYRIKDILDFDSIMAVEVVSGRSKLLRVGDLRALQNSDQVHPSLTQDLHEIDDADWKIAQQRFELIKPFIGVSTNSRKEMDAYSKAVGIGTATLYRWLRAYESTQVVSALIPRKRGWQDGKTRISTAANAMIEEVITDFYLTKQRPTAQKTITEVLQRCHKRGIEPPHPSTIRSRLSKVSERARLRGRGYTELAKNKFMPAPGRFPNADFPLSVIQIDHTPCDIILVDEIHRKPLQRAWLTLAMDVHTRMITGYYLSYDPPSETSVAMCVAHSILPKDEWLLSHNIDAQWPVWGVPKTIHVDNGADFRSNNFGQSCLQYGINLEFRPVKQPRYGGHIERLLGTLLREIHSLPGTTFASVKDRDNYDSEKHAVMTKTELEGWLLTFITKIYHHRIHSGIGMSPMRKWEIGIFGNAETVGAGLPPKMADRMTVLLDFLPSFQRTVQPIGVTIDNLTYYAEALRPWISAEDKEQPGKKRSLIFRRDPRDISTLWFFDPEIKQYFKIPLADQSIPTMSIWEFQKARELIKIEGSKSLNTVQLMGALNDLRSRVDESSARSKIARRAAQRRKEHEKKVSPATPIPADAEPAPTRMTPTINTMLDLDDITPFEDIA